MTGRRSICGILLAGACACAALGQADAPPAWPAGKPGRAAITSADRRFMVSGLSSAENMVLARKLSEHAARIEAAAGLPLPMRRDQILGVMVQSSSAPDARVLKVQGWDDGQFYQRLVVPGARQLDEEDLLEGATWLLLNRYAAEYAPASQRHGLGATVPDWISAGLAQNAQAAGRARNREWIARELAEGRILPLAQVVKQEVLPSGRWREKAYAAAAVELLFPDGDARAWTALFKSVGLRQPIDAAWLRQNCAALGARNPEAVWKEFLERKARARTAEAWGDRSLQIEEKLLQTLNFRPRDWLEAVPDDVPQELFARDLIDLRGESWTPPLAGALAMQVRSLELGAPPALLGVLASYVAFFEQLGTPPAEKKAWWQRERKEDGALRPPDDATWQVALNQLWLRAERAHQAFLESHQNRKRYVDSFDRAAPGDLAAPDPAAADLPRTRMQKAVDEFEERRNREAF
ncbi:MAG TPA: hypothetical protein P5204_00685 [Kiritimatiellia bacterium]|nr:hypothetical protein [Kiritimatiellia bacterium]